MKKPLLLALVLLLAVGGFIASPYLALNGLGDALKTGEQSQLEAHVDFPALRQNLKDQLNAAMAAQLATEGQDNPLAGFASAFATLIMDKLVDAMVTPAGLSQLVASSKDSNGDKDPFARAETGFEGLSRFRVTLPHEDGSKLNMYLHRDGLSWKLARIDLPAEALKQKAE